LGPDSIDSVPLSLAPPPFSSLPSPTHRYIVKIYRNLKGTYCNIALRYIKIQKAISQILKWKDGYCRHLQIKKKQKVKTSFVVLSFFILFH
jgi:hypothetical protein